MSISIECAVWWAEPVVAMETFHTLLDDAELGRYSAYRKEIDRRRFLTGRVLAKHAVGQRLGLPASEVVLDATCADCGKPHGKPRVVGAEERLRLSISHSGQRVGIALAEGAPVGLDVEATRDANQELIGYALNDEELAALDGLSTADRSAAFFRYWSRKEALMKATGRGLKIPLRSITLAPPGQPPRLVSSGDPALAKAKTALADLDPGDGYAGAVAVLTADAVVVSENWWPL